jgi:hypothetical protein
MPGVASWFSLRMLVIIEKAEDDVEKIRLFCL